MKTKNKCKECKRTFGTLTKEGLCASCHINKYKEWADEFQNKEKIK